MTGPEFESEIERLFGERLEPMLAPGVVLERQHNANTRVGNFRFDFYVVAGGERIAIECDGAEFHDAGRDEWRDAATLGDGVVDVVVRVPGYGIVHRLDDSMAVLAHWYPAIFSERGRRLAEGKSSAAFVRWSRGEEASSNIASIRYADERPGFHLRIERQGFGFTRAVFWTTCYGFMLQHPGLRLDEVIAAYRSDSPWRAA